MRTYPRIALVVATVLACLALTVTVAKGTTAHGPRVSPGHPCHTAATIEEDGSCRLPDGRLWDADDQMYRR